MDQDEAFYSNGHWIFIDRSDVVHSNDYRTKAIPPKAAQNGANSVWQGFKLGIRWDLIAYKCELLTKGDNYGTVL